MSRAIIRPYRASDLDDLYRICLLTGDGGNDATSMFEDPWILGHIVAAPYGLFEPSLAFVAEDELGVGGYIVGALDSKAFERRLEADWWPALRDRYPAPPIELSPDQLTPDQRTASFIHAPLTVPDELAEDYPSHLHINLYSGVTSPPRVIPITTGPPGSAGGPCPGGEPGGHAGAQGRSRVGVGVNAFRHPRQSRNYGNDRILWVAAPNGSLLDQGRRRVGVPE